MDGELHHRMLSYSNTAHWMVGLHHGMVVLQHTGWGVTSWDGDLHHTGWGSDSTLDGHVNSTFSEIFNTDNVCDNE